MRIALLGYGKMGRIIERFAIERNHEIVAKIDFNNQIDLENLNSENVDVVIEFSHPDAAYQNLKKCMSQGLNVVCGTTGWLSNRSEIEALAKLNNAGFFYSSNYSIGVQLFFKLNQQLAKLMNPYPQYEINTIEIHHTEKKDAPSGTAITLAEGIMENIDSKSTFINNQIAKAHQVPIWSQREGKVPGTHIVKYISPVDTLEISHTAHSREGFALGAVIAAEWLNGKPGVWGMDDLLKN